MSGDIYCGAGNGAGMPVDLPPLEHEDVTTNDITLHVVKAGPEDGEPVILLHGFPEFWYGWRHQIPALTDAGYRVWVPDQRGYNTSEKPPSVEAYATDELARDAIGLIEATGSAQARVVGHDWGAAVLWYLLLTHPDRIERAVVANVPHPAAFDAFMPGSPRQLLKSWYIFFFQLPRLPEWTFSRDDWRGLRWFIDTSNQPETFSETHLDRYREAWSQPGAFTAMINWYRAIFQADAPDPPTMRVEPETLLIWGAKDAYLHRDMAPASAAYLENGGLEVIEDATHWVQHERPDRVNELMISFLQG